MSASQSDYYTRFQKAVARSLNWNLYNEKQVYFYADFFKQQESVFMQPLGEALDLLERRLLEFFSVNMVAMQRGLTLEQCDYEELRTSARGLSLQEVFHEMQRYPLTVSTMLFYLFQEKEKPTPCLVTIGNVIAPSSSAKVVWSSASLREFQKTPVAQRSDKLSAWLTFNDGTILDPTLKLTRPELADASLLSLKHHFSLTPNQLSYDPLLVGGNECMRIFGQC